ncbi:MAG: hypothetical protein GJ680_01465 [Alteromonadaceae bacterium]|nr:hypothetical protein [Alteromonadaceae bacterium]
MKNFYLAIILVLVTCSAAAQEASNVRKLIAMDLGEMLKVEIATGSQKTLSDAPAVASVITAQQIKNMGA